MDVQELPPDRVEQLRSAPFTYSAVGGTASAPPRAYHFFSRSHTVNHRDFETAAAQLMTWQVQSRAGLKVAASSPTVTVDSVVVLRWGVGFAALSVPCRVVYVVDEPNLKGFAYGTLPGHPEAGEESFSVRRHDDGRVEFTVLAFSKPVTRAARLGGPVTRGLQRLITRRYLASLDI